MPAYLISYDNRAPRDYQRLYQLMAVWKAVRLNESNWMANLAGPAHAVRDLVGRTLESNDVVAVVEVKPGSDWATMNADLAANAWLSAHVMPSKKAA